MRHKQWMAGTALLALAMAGCGKPSGGAGDAASATADTQTAAATSADPKPETAATADPATTVSAFLEAVRRGNDQKANALLSQVARQKMAEINYPIMPAASDTAKFQIGKVEYVNEDGTVGSEFTAKCTGARVAAEWTDRIDESKTQTDHSLWVVRQEAEGWRVCGVAAMVFSGEAPLLLDFENPQEMKKRLQWLEEEMARRGQQETSEARAEKNPKDSIRR
jgi:hypothetical protein